MSQLWEFTLTYVVSLVKLPDKGLCGLVVLLNEEACCLPGPWQNSSSTLKDCAAIRAALLRMLLRE